MTSCAWLWAYAGLLLMLMELFAPGFVICFFGLSAMTVALCRAVFGESFDLTWQLASFSGFSILYILLLRRWLKKTFTGEKKVAINDLDDEYKGRIGKIITAVNPPLEGRVLIGDSQWNAIADYPIDCNTEVKVLSRNNLTMKVEALS